MGGLGSGRPRQRPVVEDGLTIDIGRFVGGRAEEGSCTIAGSVTWRSAGADGAGSSIGFSARLYPGERTGELRLRYTVTDPWDDTRHDIDEWIELEGLPQPFGGLLWYCRCPITERRCRTLCKPPGAHRFASRQAYRLRYRSQQKAPYERAVEQAQKIRKRLGASYGVGDPVYRPCGMHERTFERHMDRLDHYEDLIESHLMRFLFNTHQRLIRRSQG